MAVDLVTRESIRGGMKVTVSAAGCGLIEEMAAGGHPDMTICKALGLTMNTFRRCRREQDEVQEALDYGRGKLEAEIASILLQKARGSGKESLIAAIFLAKARCGWREGEAPADTRPNVTINLPDSKTPEAYLEMVRANYRAEPNGPELKAENNGS